jgi:hypothetical protein
MRRLSFALAISGVGLFGLGCTLDDPSTLTASQVFSVTIAKPTLSADSISRTNIEVQMSGETKDDAEVTFQTDKGRFLGADASKPGELKIKASARTATAVFVANAQAGEANLAITVGGILRDTSITLSPSRPTKILLSASQLTAKADGVQTITFTASLVRSDLGAVSQGTRVDFLVSDTLGVEFPELRGIATYTGTASPPTFRLARTTSGSFLVQAKVGDDAGGIVSNSIRVSFTP